MKAIWRKGRKMYYDYNGIVKCLVTILKYFKNPIKFNNFVGSWKIIKRLIHKVIQN